MACINSVFNKLQLELEVGLLDTQERLDQLFKQSIDYTAV